MICAEREALLGAKQLEAEFDVGGEELSHAYSSGPRAIQRVAQSGRRK
jgi:hypothetical protein